MKRIYIIIVCLLNLNTYAQDHLKEAEKLHDRLIYIEAAKEYELYLKDAKDVSAQTWRNIGDTYYNLKEYYKANEAYKNWFDVVGNEGESQNILQYYDSFRRLKQYLKANNFAESIIRSNRSEAFLNGYLEERARFQELLEADTLYTIKNVDFNSQYADFGGSFKGDEFVFTTARNKDGKKIYERDNTPYLDIYKIANPGTQMQSEPTVFNEKIESEYHDGTASFSPDGKYIYYASSFQNGAKKVFEGDKRNYFKIYRVDLTSNKLKKELLPLNGDAFSAGQPFVTEDGKQLFFSSDMPGGLGKADIYVCDIFEDGTYSKPRNLGPNINTLGDDFFPFFRNNILYFSSAGHVGFGGLDIFKSYYRDGIYGTPVNLGAVLNTNADDFAYIESKDANTGYFSSDRAGGKGGDDIYSFTYDLEKCIQYISGTVYNIETNEPIPGASVTVYDSSKIEYKKLNTDEKGNYEVELICGLTYGIEARKPGYSEDELNFTTDILPDRRMNMLDFKLKDLSEIFVTEGDVEKIRIDPIYFEYYRYNINDMAAIQMRKVLDAMNAYPDMIIKIESHTDQRGTDYFNKTLSTNRALSTRDWLIERGIDKSRIQSAIGYGESRPINICDEEGKNCTDVEYSENRRSEFIVVSR